MYLIDNTNKYLDKLCYLNFFSVQRDPKKRKVKPVEKHLIQVDFGLDDSEDDSDFEVEDHKKGIFLSFTPLSTASVS
jgi:hypothetical protein